MSVYRVQGCFSFNCDGDNCKKNYESLSRDFKTALEEAKEYGWSVSQFTGQWQHHCPACTAKLGG